MRIDNPSAINSYDQKASKSDAKLDSKRASKSASTFDDIKSKEVHSDKGVADLKHKGIRQFTLDNFLPKKLKSKEDRVDISSTSVGSSLELTAQQILDKINEAIQNDFPDYVVSTAPEDNTSEKISNNIIQGTLALFSTYAAQNTDMQGEELLSSFMSAIRSGVEKGYGQARDILGEIGALKVSGVEDAISETMRLVEVGFKNFEAQYRKDNGLPAVERESTSEQS